MSDKIIECSLNNCPNCTNELQEYYTKYERTDTGYNEIYITYKRCPNCLEIYLEKWIRKYPIS